MGRTDRIKEGAKRNPNEGTSARTRAFSFEDIMSRRKKKLNSNTNEKDNKTESFVNANSTMDHSSLDCLQITRPSKDTVKESSKKAESVSRREVDHIKRRDTDAYDLEVGAKVTSNHRRSNKDKERTDEKYSHHTSRTGNFPAVSEKSSGRKRLKDFEVKDEYDEYYRKAKRDRKGHSHNDDKYKAEKSKKSKKYDSAKMRDMMYSERNGHKNYYIEPFYEDPRVKRRSRSVEYDPERGRSTSLSPLSRKHAYHMQECGETYRDKLKKKHSDGDKYKTSGDGDRYKASGDSDRYKTSGDGDNGDRNKTSGDDDRYKTLGDGGDRYKTSGDVDRYKTSGDGGYSSGHHRKHSSGLGGYSPRKRKSEQAVKTPSPTVRSPERKVATWDQLPTGTNITSPGSIFTSFPLSASKVVESASSIAATPTTIRTHPLTLINSASVVMSTSLESVQLTQATRPMRRLYIENIPPSVSEKAVINHLNEVLVSSGTNHIQTKPCISCIINKEKAQALVEFLTPEDATAALSFDGNSLFGSVLKMRRPKDFIEATSGVPDKTEDVVKVVSDVVMDSPYKIFVGGISSSLSSKMLMEIASSFGPLKAYHSEFNEELNGLCAFLEYEDHSITSKACAVLDGLKLGGSILTAVKASPEINGKEDNASHPSYDIPPHAKPLLANVSPVIKLQNVVNPEDLATLHGNDLEEMLEDIRLECARFGTVKAVQLVRDSNSTNEPKTEPSEVSVSVNTSARLESNIGDTHREEIMESTSNYAGVIKDDEIQETSETLKELQDAVKSVQIQEGCHEDAAVSEIPAPKEIQDNNSSPEEIKDGKLAEDTDLDPVATGKEKGVGDDDRKIVEEIDTNDSRELQAYVSDAFVPGCVIVEFQRKEAACSAAHCLHGRLYGELIVEVEYIPYDLYLKRFPK